MKKNSLKEDIQALLFIALFMSGVGVIIWSLFLDKSTEGLMPGGGFLIISFLNAWSSGLFDKKRKKK